jgi:hypothetical protein
MTELDQWSLRDESGLKWLQTELEEKEMRLGGNRGEAKQEKIVQRRESNYHILASQWLHVLVWSSSTVGCKGFPGVRWALFQNCQLLSGS